MASGSVLPPKSTWLAPKTFTKSNEEPFSNATHSHAQTQIPFKSLRAGQFNVGLTAVQDVVVPTEENYFLTGYTNKSGVFHAPAAGAADAYMKDKTVPVVLGPDGYHLVDGHHRTTGNYLLSVKYPEYPDYLYATQVADLSSLSMDEFWTVMAEGDGRSSFIWLNNRGVPSSISNLPFIPGLTDDALRSFSSNIAANYLAYEILDPVVYFQEFYWADYLRHKVFLSGAGWETAGGNPNAPFVSSSYEAVATEAARLSSASRCQPSPAVHRGSRTEWDSPHGLRWPVFRGPRCVDAVQARSFRTNV